MELQVLFNSNSINENLSVGWGVSFLINKRILFDTGEKGNLLVKNIEALRIDLSLIELIVVSHDHWDHTGGLQDILRVRKGIKVYGCRGFSKEFKENIISHKGNYIESKPFESIKESVYLSGELIGEYKSKPISEQSLIIDTEKGLIIITGCAHPGILRITRYIKDHFPDKRIHCVLGGFHLIGQPMSRVKNIAQEVQSLGVGKVGATHCTGSEAENIFKTFYGEDFLSLKAGERLILG